MLPQPAGAPALGLEHLQNLAEERLDHGWVRDVLLQHRRCLPEHLACNDHRRTHSRHLPDCGNLLVRLGHLAVDVLQLQLRSCELLREDLAAELLPQRAGFRKPVRGPPYPLPAQ